MKKPWFASVDFGSRFASVDFFTTVFYGFTNFSFLFSSTANHRFLPASVEVFISLVVRGVWMAFRILSSTMAHFLPSSRLSDVVRVLRVFIFSLCVCSREVLGITPHANKAVNKIPAAEGERCTPSISCAVDLTCSCLTLNRGFYYCKKPSPSEQEPGEGGGEPSQNNYVLKRIAERERQGLRCARYLPEGANPPTPFATPIPLINPARRPGLSAPDNQENLVVNPLTLDALRAWAEKEGRGFYTRYALATAPSDADRPAPNAGTEIGIPVLAPDDVPTAIVQKNCVALSSVLGGLRDPQKVLRVLSGGTSGGQGRRGERAPHGVEAEDQFLVASRLQDAQQHLPSRPRLKFLLAADENKSEGAGDVWLRHPEVSKTFVTGLGGAAPWFPSMGITGSDGAIALAEEFFHTLQYFVLTPREVCLYHKLYANAFVQEPSRTILGGGAGGSPPRPRYYPDASLAGEIDGEPVPTVQADEYLAVAFRRWLGAGPTSSSLRGPWEEDTLPPGLHEYSVLGNDKQFNKTGREWLREQDPAAFCLIAKYFHPGDMWNPGVLEIPNRGMEVEDVDQFCDEGLPPNRRAVGGALLRQLGKGCPNADVGWGDEYALGKEGGSPFVQEERAMSRVRSWFLIFCSVSWVVFLLCLLCCRGGFRSSSASGDEDSKK